MTHDRHSSTHSASKTKEARARVSEKYLDRMGNPLSPDAAEQ